MGFVSEFKKALDGEAAGCSYKAAGLQVKCPHCGGMHFFEGEALLDSRFMSFVGYEWMGDSATVLTCTRCGHVEWFAGSGRVERSS